MPVPARPIWQQLRLPVGLASLRLEALALLHSCLAWLLLLSVLAQPALSLAQHGTNTASQPHAVAPRPANQGPAAPGYRAPAASQAYNSAGRSAGGGAHLPQWFENHQTLNPLQKEQALRQEPGFNHLPQPQQQHLIDRLHKLDNAPPEVRQRILARNEIFEHLPPEQKQEIRGASQALTQMQPERNQAVRHAFRDLRGLPPDQRQSVLNSARFQAEFSPQERTVLGHLLSIEPYQP